MPSSVFLCVYDLSNGIVGAVSKPLLRKHFDGIWHTSVVVFNKEVHYRKAFGIQINNPGDAVIRSGFRKKRMLPKQTIYMGQTFINEQAFDERLAGMSEIYTRKNYSLLAFNCIYFTQECIRCLMGISIPSWIKDLPADVFVAIGAAVFRQFMAILECFTKALLTHLQIVLEGPEVNRRRPVNPGVELMMVPVHLAINLLELGCKAAVKHLLEKRANRRHQGATASGRADQAT